MKCPECENTLLREDHAFCFKCGHEILKAKEEPSSPCSQSVDDNSKAPATNVEDSVVQEDTDVSLDGGQRKGKDDGELERKPAKQKSVGNENNSIPGGVDDVPANALQNLQIANDTLEVQQNTVPGTASGLVSTPEHTKASDSMSEQTSNTEYQPTGRGNCILCNNCLISRAVIGSFLSSVRVQTKFKFMQAFKFNFQLSNCQLFNQ